MRGERGGVLQAERAGRGESEAGGWERRQAIRNVAARRFESDEIRQRAVQALEPSFG